MPFDPLHENYYALQLAINAPIRLSPEGAFLSLSRAKIQRGRRTQRLSNEELATIRELSITMPDHRIAEIYSLPVETIRAKIAASATGRGRKRG